MTNRRPVGPGIGLMLTFGLACGSGVHHLGDGGTDAPGTADAPEPIDAPSTSPVTLVVTLDGAPAQGATVYFQNADSTLVAELQTGSDGTAAQTMTAGGFVSLIEPGGTLTPPTNQNVDTFAAVQPGDVLHVDVVTDSSEPAQISVTVTAPVDPNGSAVDYELLTTCGAGALASPTEEVARRIHPLDLTPATVLLDGCPATTDMLVFTTASNNKALDSLYEPGVAVSDGSSVTLTGSYLTMGTQNVDDVNIPRGVPDITVAHHLVGPHGELADLPVPGFDFGSGSAQVSYEQVVNPLVSILVQEFEAGSDILDTQRFVDWGSASLATVDIDAGAERLPDYAAAPSFDVADQQVQWTLTGGNGSAVDALYAQVSFARTNAGGSGSAEATASATWIWNILAPGTETGAIALPTLPTDVFVWNGSAGDTIAIGSLEMATNPGGYDAVRALGLDEDFDAILDVSTPSGHVVIDDFAGPEALGPALAARHHARTRVWHAAR